MRVGVSAFRLVQGASPNDAVVWAVELELSQVEIGARPSRRVSALRGSNRGLGEKYTNGSERPFCAYRLRAFRPTQAVTRRPDRFIWMDVKNFTILMRFENDVNLLVLSARIAAIFADFRNGTGVSRRRFNDVM